MTSAQRVQALLDRERTASIFRCPQCGSFLDAARVNPETSSLARKCVSCLDWYPVATLRSRPAR